MGFIHADILLKNTFDVLKHMNREIKEEEIRHLTVKMLVDTGAFSLCINENIRHQLGLRIMHNQVVEYADGSKASLPVTEPVEVHFGNRSTSARALVLPADAEPLLGSIPLEDMDVVLDPRNERMLINPETPNVARKKVK